MTLHLTLRSLAKITRTTSRRAFPYQILDLMGRHSSAVLSWLFPKILSPERYELEFRQTDELGTANLAQSSGLG